MFVSSFYIFILMITVIPQLTKAFLLLFQYLPIIGKYICPCGFFSLLLNYFLGNFQGEILLGQKIGISPQCFLCVVILPL